MSLVKLLRGGQVTLPSEARKALRLTEGDYLEAEVVEKGVLLRPVKVVDREAAWESIRRAQASVRYVGPEPEPSDDELLAMADDEVHATRREHDQSGS